MGSKRKITLFITTGDVDGIGLEVTAKALNDLGPQPNVTFVVYGEKKGLKRWKPLLSDFTEDDIRFVESSQAPVKWVEEAARHCLKFPSRFGLVTGPLSKTGIQAAGFSCVGHTELLKKISRTPFLFQSYLGSQMNVLLVTDHISLQKVPRRLKAPFLLETALRQGLQLKKALHLKGTVALLALDPHAGESGIIGHQDEMHRKLLKRLGLSSTQVIGPLPADTAFETHLRQRVGLYIALYHDQGLIPFKSLHGFNEGVHLTLGLPFVRTSVDHGTAKDIFGKNKALPGSMKHAIKTAIKLVGKKR